MSSSEWAREVKPASKALGARYTPRSSMARCSLPKRAVSAALASSKLRTGPSHRKKPNMALIDPPVIGRPALRAPSRIPSIRRLVTASRRS